MKEGTRRSAGMTAALLTPLFMGMAPVFGKLAIRTGIDPYTLAALRTCLAALALWAVFALFFRQYTFIFPAGLMGTAAVGAVNGLGSLLYYNGLLLLDDASLAQMLNMTYVVFALLMTHAAGQRISALSIGRALLALGAVYLLAAAGPVTAVGHWAGVGLMLGAACLYALHVSLSQRVMFEMPAPTMTLYSMTFMGLTVLIARLVVGRSGLLPWGPLMSHGWWFIAGLAGVTALSRLTLFAGVRNLGGLQTVLLNMAEMGVTLLVAFLWLGETMTLWQWAGVLIMAISVLLANYEDNARRLWLRLFPHRPAPDPSVPPTAPQSAEQLP